MNHDQEENPNGLLGILLLLAAAGLTLATIVLLIVPAREDNVPPTATPDTSSAVQPTETNPPPPTPTHAPTIAPQNTLPPLDPQTADTLLGAPLEAAQVVNAMQIDRARFNPYTIIPERPRSEVITYEVVRGDTIEAIAERFGLEPETIAWSNPRHLIQLIRPGDLLNIPPSDGVYIQAIGSARTIADYAEQYGLDDPYLVIDHEANNLAGLTPDTVPNSGTYIFFPGGEAEEVVWQVDIVVTSAGGGSSGNVSSETVVFQNGHPGSCAPQEITSGGAGWANPVGGSYTITRGFSPVVHSGIDLAGADGTPIQAANDGRVIFAGLNNNGYGYTVAIVHGPFMTVYGHLSAVYASCGQVVSTGTTIGAMGSTGNSTGTHLHFELRVRQGSTYAAQDPAFTIGF